MKGSAFAASLERRSASRSGAGKKEHCIPYPRLNSLEVRHTLDRGDIEAKSDPQKYQ